MATKITAQLELCDDCAPKVKEAAKKAPNNRALAVNAYMILCMKCKMQEPKVTIDTI